MSWKSKCVRNVLIIKNFCSVTAKFSICQMNSLWNSQPSWSLKEANTFRHTRLKCRMIDFNFHSKTEKRYIIGIDHGRACLDGGTLSNKTKIIENIYIQTKKAFAANQHKTKNHWWFSKWCLSLAISYGELRSPPLANYRLLIDFSDKAVAQKKLFKWSTLRDNKNL